MEEGLAARSGRSLGRVWYEERPEVALPLRTLKVADLDGSASALVSSEVKSAEVRWIAGRAASWRRAGLRAGIGGAAPPVG